MKWFQGERQRKNHHESLASVPSPKDESKNANIDTESESTELALLFVRPSISKIFESPPDKSLINADFIETSHGTYSAIGMNEHQLELIPILAVSERCGVGYALATRLDLQYYLHKLVTDSKATIDYPLGLFTNRDVIMITVGSYVVMQTFQNASAAMNAIEEPLNEFRASRICYAATTTNKENINNLRCLAAEAQEVVLQGGIVILPHIVPQDGILISPHTVTKDWQPNFLEPIFKHAREKFIETRQ